MKPHAPSPGGSTQSPALTEDDGGEEIGLRRESLPSNKAGGGGWGGYGESAAGICEVPWAEGQTTSSRCGGEQSRHEVRDLEVDNMGKAREK